MCSSRSTLSTSWREQMSAQPQFEVLWKYFFLQGWVGDGVFSQPELDWIWKEPQPEMRPRREGNFDLGPARAYFLEPKKTQLTLTLHEVEQCVRLYVPRTAC